MFGGKNYKQIKRRRELVLNKGREKYVFRYEDGKEEELIEALIEKAKDKRVEFDFFDAAVLSFKLTQSLIGRIDDLPKQGGLEKETGYSK